MIIEISGIDGSGKSTAIGSLRKKINGLDKYWAYERSFKSESVRWLECISMKNGLGNRPQNTFSYDTIELLRLEELFRYRRSINDCENQIFFLDSYIVEQYSRLFSRNVDNSDALLLLNNLPIPDLSVYIRVTPETALERMSQRAKGDAILLERDPLQTTRKSITSLENSISEVSYPVEIIDGSLTPEDVSSEILALMVENEIVLS